MFVTSKILLFGSIVLGVVILLFLFGRARSSLLRTSWSQINGISAQFLFATKSDGVLILMPVDTTQKKSMRISKSPGNFKENSMGVVVECDDQDSASEVAEALTENSQIDTQIVGNRLTISVINQGAKSLQHAICDVIRSCLVGLRIEEGEDFACIFEGTADLDGLKKKIDTGEFPKSDH